MSTFDERRKLAVARELEELAVIAKNFEALAAEAQRHTNELLASFRRMNKIAQEENDVDRQIDRLVVSLVEYKRNRGGES